MMTGWRVGYAIAPRPVRETMQMISGGMTYTTPSISQRAALHALPLRHEIEENVISVYRERVMEAADALEHMPFVEIVRPRGTFYLFPDIRKTGMTSTELTAYLLEKAHILVSPGNAFGKSGEGHIRIAVTQDSEKIREAMRRMKALTF
jgi:aspartate/methionine/tyrosine aminotransferase